MIELGKRLLRRLAGAGLRLVKRISRHLPFNEQESEKLKLSLKNKELTDELNTMIAEISDSFRGLAALPSPASHSEVLSSLALRGIAREEAIDSYLKTLFALRRIELLDRILEDDALAGGQLLKFYRARLANYRGETSLDDERIEPFYGEMLGHPILRKRALNFALQQATRAERPDIVLRLCQSEEFPARAAEATLFGALNLLTRDGERECAGQLLRTILADASDVGKLYFLEPTAELLGEVAAEGVDLAEWRTVLEALKRGYAPVDNEDGETFRKFIIAPLESLPKGERDCMNVRFSRLQRQRLKKLIASAIERKAPFSLIRVGDGESYAFDPPPLPGSLRNLLDEDNAARERSWWGEEIPAARRRKIAIEVRDAIQDADVVGIPSVYRVLRDLPARGERFGKNRVQRGLLVLLSAMAGGAVMQRDSILTEDRCHQLLFPPQSLPDLTRGAMNVVVVSCWTREQIGSHFGPSTYFIVVPGHSRLRHLRPAASPLFSIYDDVAAEVERLAEPGSVFLIGAGLIGKILAARARAKGAVALDVGAAFDYLAGYKTRGLADFTHFESGLA